MHKRAHPKRGPHHLSVKGRRQATTHGAHPAVARRDAFSKQHDSDSAHPGTCSYIGRPSASSTCRPPHHPIPACPTNAQSPSHSSRSLLRSPKPAAARVSPSSDEWVMASRSVSRRTNGCPSTASTAAMVASLTRTAWAGVGTTTGRPPAPEGGAPAPPPPLSLPLPPPRVADRRFLEALERRVLDALFVGTSASAGEATDDAAASAVAPFLTPFLAPRGAPLPSLEPFLAPLFAPPPALPLVPPAAPSSAPPPPLALPPPAALPPALPADVAIARRPAAAVAPTAAPTRRPPGRHDGGGAPPTRPPTPCRDDKADVAAAATRPRHAGRVGRDARSVQATAAAGSGGAGARTLHVQPADRWGRAPPAAW